jgi:diacylglycerol kinase (ATP)
VTLGEDPAQRVPPTVKAMNNYLGVGVDAQIAHEFHHMREQYPHWFQSQITNKLW